MNLFSKKLGANGSVSIDLLPEGVKFVLADAEVLTDQGLSVLIRPGILIDTVVKLCKSPRWMVYAAAVAKSELEELSKKIDAVNQAHADLKPEVAPPTPPVIQ